MSGGFTPGQTDWMSAKEFLSPISDAIYEGIDSDKLVGVEIHLPNTYYTGLDAGRSVIHNYRIRANLLSQLRYDDKISLNCRGDTISKSGISACRTSKSLSPVTR